MLRCVDCISPVSALTRRVDHRHASPASPRQQSLCRRHRLPGKFTAGAGKLTIGVAHRPCTTEISLIVEVDCENCRIVADKSLALVSLIDRCRVGVDNVLPAMIFEIPRHSQVSLSVRRAPLKLLRQEILYSTAVTGDGTCGTGCEQKAHNR